MAATGGAAGRNLFFNGLKQVRKSMSCNSLKSVAKMVNEGSHSVSSNRRLLALAAGQESFLVKSMHTKAMARLEMRSLQKSIQLSRKIRLNLTFEQVRSKGSF